MPHTPERRRGRDAHSVPPLRVEWYKYNERDKTYYTPPHVHRYHQWYHVLRGEARFTVEKETFTLGPGQSVLASPGTERAVVCGARPPAYFAAVFEAGPQLDLRAIECRLLTLPAPLEGDLDALVAEARAPGSDAESFVPALILRLLVGLKRAQGLESAGPVASGSASRGTPSPLNRNSQRELAERVERFLAQNYHRPITRADLAEVLNASAGHVARVYRAVSGKTLLERVTELRLSAAKALLLDSTLSIGQIALEVGYASFSHFTTTFQRREGLNPGDYRRARGLTAEQRGSIEKF